MLTMSDLASGVSASATTEPMPMVSKNAVGFTRSMSSMTPPTTGRTTLRRPGMLETAVENDDDPEDGFGTRLDCRTACEAFGRWGVSTGTGAKRFELHEQILQLAMGIF